MQEAALIVTFEARHKILLTEGATQCVLGYSEELLRGRTLNVLQGPRTDPARLSSAIKLSSFCITSSLQMDLYDCDGRCRTLLVTCQPFFGFEGTAEACKLSFESSQAITLDEALGMVNGPKAIASVGESYDDANLQLINADFTRFSGFSAAELLGCGMSSLAADEGSLRTIVENAASGRGYRTSLFMRTTQDAVLCSLSCVPVVTRAGGQVSHIALLIRPTPDCVNRADAADLQSSTSFPSARSSPQQGCHVSCDVSGRRPGSPPSAHCTAVRRAGNDLAAAVAAAATMTAGPAPAAAAAGGAGMLSIDYARRLYRKYARNSAALRAAAAAAADPSANRNNVAAAARRRARSRRPTEVWTAPPAPAPAAVPHHPPPPPPPPPMGEEESEAAAPAILAPSESSDSFEWASESLGWGCFSVAEIGGGGGGGALW